MDNNTNTVIQIGNIRAKNITINGGGFDENPQAGRVYSVDGVAPTLNTMQGGHRQPYVVVKNYETN